MISLSTPSSTHPHTDPGRAETRGFLIGDRNSVDLLPYVSPVKAAVLVDVAFFLRRCAVLAKRELSPPQAVQALIDLAHAHLTDDAGFCNARLYRVFVYDAAPAAWRGHTPIEKRAIDLYKSPQACWRDEFHQVLRRTPNVALRLGEIPTANIYWQLRPKPLKDLLQCKRMFEDLSDADFSLNLRQKGVDMRIGLDIASIAFKKLANKIVLISGDSDFVPAAKLARREGVDFVLDPVNAPIRPSLHEHVDSLRCPMPSQWLANTSI